ncbi:helicase-associated domain-containing protein [Streptomyces mirabilis]|uniref:helicase-associated domain-containing protein n=1 Tax=Streptomyces mirabilis TaxID=68239 RepID=UPI0036BDF036
MSAPEPRSVGELADRLQRPGSFALALPRLALPHLQVAEALATLASASRDALANLLLGVLARGVLFPMGAALSADDTEGPASVCRRLLPAATGTARIGADLTAVVTGTPSARLTALLDSVADREAGGTASVRRFSAGGIRRALDAGHTPDDIAADLAAAAVGPLPLSYLITDVARSHGRVRVAPAACVIHSKEPALLAELAAHRKFDQLGLRQLAPTVLVSRTPLDKTLAGLRAEGCAPVAETTNGTVRIEQTERRRAAQVPPPRLPRGEPRSRNSDPRAVRAPAAVDLKTLAARLRAAPPMVPEPDPYNGVPFDSDTEEIIVGHASQPSLTDVRPLPRPRRHARIARESERDGTRSRPPALEKQEPDMVSDGRPPRTPSQLWDSVWPAVRCAVIRWRRGLPTSRVGAVRAATSGCRG